MQKGQLFQPPFLLSRFFAYRYPRMRFSSTSGRAKA